MNKLFTKVASICLGLAMAVGVGVAVSSSRKEATRVDAATVTYRHIFSAKPNTGNNVVLSSVNWNITATELGDYNSRYYAGVQIGTKKVDGQICLTSSSAWGGQSGTYKDKTVISEVRVWMNKGGGTTSATVTIGGGAATSDGTQVVKNSSASSYSDTTCVTFTPASSYNTGVVVITVNASEGAAGYICAMEIDCDAPASPSEDPAFTIDKNSVNLIVGGSSTTVTATPNEYVSGSATYTWSRTAGDDCVTLTNANSAIVTIAPKGTALSASCTLTIAVTGCTSKTVSVTVKKVSTAESPFTITEARSLIAANVAEDMTGVYVHGFVSQVDTFSSPYITYWISDDASTTNQFEVYKGKNLNNTDFSSINDLAIGYEVVVYGNLTKYNSTDEFSKDNYIVSLVRPSTFEVSTTTDGLHLSTDEVGTTGSVTLTTASKYKGTNVVVTCGNGTASINNNVVTLSDVDDDVTINAEIVDAEIVSIALSGYPTKLALDSEFSYSGLIVTGTYDDWVSPHTSEPIVSGYTVDSSAVKMDTEGVYTVTVTYGSVNASYQVTVANIFDPSKGEYHEVTNLNQLYNGAHVAIVDADGGYSMKEGFDSSKNNIQATSISKNAKKGIISKTNVLDVELVKTADNEYRFKIDDDLYLYAQSSSSNNLKAASLTTSGDNGKFLISLSNNGVFSVVAQGSNTRNYMRFNPNSGSPIFSCYSSTSTTGSTVAFYVFETYKAEANAYAETFIKGENDGNTCSAIKSAWSSLETIYDNLTGDAQAIFENQVHESYEEYEGKTEYTVGRAVALYDQILIVNGTSSYNDFMGRTVPGGKLQLSNVVRLNTLVQDSNFSVTVIIVISVMSLAAVAGFAIISKRKHR